ncbi:MAG: exodeoxyribonuclease III [Zoogloeaceae bacterium]|jgi:exodeoxyribonuclease-3|nr:exodeoxyribonuclease III [Zoogloeaceae bacterium]
MKIASWNVNSLKVRLARLLDWLAESGTDVVCLQETKLEDANFPHAELAASGYQAACSGQKTYNGVALVSRYPLEDLQIGNPHFPDPQKRLIAATINGVRVISAYVPNGQAVGGDKYAYKLEWLAALAVWLREELATRRELALCGDFNIAPEDRDVYNPTAWAGQILCSQPERAAFSALLDLGLQDSFRLFPQPEKSFSWWDYRMLGFQKNHGLRIDHILLSAPLAARAAAAGIDRAPRKCERPSDHAPVYAVLRSAAT